MYEHIYLETKKVFQEISGNFWKEMQRISKKVVAKTKQGIGEARNCCAPVVLID